MKRMCFIVFVGVLCLVLAFPGVAQEKKVWGKRNIWAKELSGHLTRLYEGLTQLVERGLSEELGDPDFLGKMKEEMKERFHPELIPEGPAEVEQFATDFVSYIIDTYHELKSEWLAEESFIEEIKKLTIENMSSWSRCPYALAPKLFDGWRIQALPPVYLGAEFEEPYNIGIVKVDLQGPFLNGDVYLLEGGKKKFIGKVGTVLNFDNEGKPDRFISVLNINDQEVGNMLLEDFMILLHKVLWEMYPGDAITLRVSVYMDYRQRTENLMIAVPVARRDKWLILPES